MRDLGRFAALILTHGRPDRVITLASLRRSGYTGRVYLVVDDEDPTLEEYRDRFGADAVLVFSKSEVARRIDAADLSTDRRTIVYARVAAFDLARDLGLEHFIQLDDDYTDFLYRFDEERRNRGQAIRSLDGVFAAMIDLLERSGAVTVAMSQGGDHMGGVRSSTLRAGYKRKAMNSFVVRTDRPVPFSGRLNEDVNAYCLDGSRGGLYLTVCQLQLNQVQTQRSAGGMTDAYLATGTYVKSFYSVMLCPSFVRISTMGRRDRRIHHVVSWEHAVPKIVAPELRRAA